MKEKKKGREKGKEERKKRRGGKKEKAIKLTTSYSAAHITTI